MTHEPEDSFHEKVREYLYNNYGVDNVEENYYLEETYRYADFWVDDGLVVLAIEVENGFESVMKGIGQAELYAQHKPNATPVVIVPKGHIEEPEAEYLRRVTPVVELDL